MARTDATINGDGSLRYQSVATVNDDGLVVTYKKDADGDGTFERVETSTTVLNDDGSTTETMQVHSANNVLLAQTQTHVSDDGLVVTRSSDADGDGDFDLQSTTTTELQSDGGTKVTSEVRDESDALRNSRIETQSDNGRIVTGSIDLNGDGVVDENFSNILADDGTRTESVDVLNVDGSLQSSRETVTSANGLEVTRKNDADGDGTFEFVEDSSTVLNNDGSITQSVSQKAENGVTVSQMVSTTSANGLTTTTTEDYNNDGSIDVTAISHQTIEANGATTSSLIRTAADGTELDSRSVNVSADGRTRTDEFDADGNGISDAITTSTIADNGAISTSTDYYSTGGSLTAVSTSTMSSDGLEETYSFDRNADGRVDLYSKDITTLKQDGSSERVVEHRDGRFVNLGREEYITDDNGLNSSAVLDLDGDGVREFSTKGQTEFNDDGSIVQTQTTRDALDNQLSKITTTTSGDGLETVVETDLTGNGAANRITSLANQADGASTSRTVEYDAGNNRIRETSSTISADGRTQNSTIDTDGDGSVDYQVSSQEDLNGGLTRASEDLRDSGQTAARVEVEQSANGMHSSVGIDVDADGNNDITRTTDVQFASNGDRIETFEEKFGNGDTAYREVRTTSADGLNASTEINVDGDGTVDAIRTVETILNDDGSRQTVTETRNMEGALQNSSTITQSSDGRETIEILDYDGNGITDKIRTVSTELSGEQTVVEKAFNKAGYETQTFSVTTSADGLTTVINRGEVEQTITRSAVDDGSYSWNKGVPINDEGYEYSVSHEVDSVGFDTWSITTLITTIIPGIPESYGNPGTPDQTVISFESTSVRLDGEAKQRIFAEAERIYDTVLDRDLDFGEYELLIQWFDGNQLDQTTLVQNLINSHEFSTRYGVMTQAEFVTQIYLNTFGRAPGLDELDQYLNQPNSITARTDIALELAQSSEHVVVGNGHMATNNFDVIINPATLERSLDEAYIHTTISSLADVIYDRDATDQELSYFAHRLLADTDNLEDVAQAMLNVEGGISGQASNSLNSVSASAADQSSTSLVEQAFINALGRSPTTVELQTWEENISSGRITTAQFIASLAQSTEHLEVGNSHVSSVYSSTTNHTGTSASETLSGTSGQDQIVGLEGDDTLLGNTGSDILIGGTGDDYLDGNTGNDRYEWSKGDGNDTIDDDGTSQAETDTLALLNVTSDDVSLSRTNGSTNLDVEIISTGEIITVENQFYTETTAYGIEAIEFSDGVKWSLSDILDHTTVEGTVAAETINGSLIRDNLFGLDGDDTLNGHAGDDTLVGGIGLDSLHGGDGNDRYQWSIGDGNDTINDTGTSQTEVDTLVLIDVASDDISLSRTNGSNHLNIEIISTGETITVENRFHLEASAFGIESLEFSDGVKWTLSDILDHTKVEGTATADTFNGSDIRDNLFGLDGDDTLLGKTGDDTLVGGTGVDRLEGNAGSDRYEWSKGDGNDTINDDGTSQTETDTLVLKDVMSNDAALSRTNGSTQLNIEIISTGEIITVEDRFYDATSKLGIEEIEFSDGVTWALSDILDHTNVEGTAAAETIHGSDNRDNLFGHAGDDTLYGNEGDDTLVGGTGVDTLRGEDGSDRYVWSQGDGNDTVDDVGASQAEVDSLVLTDLASSDAQLTIDGSNLKVNATTTNETLTVTNQFASSTAGYGLEVIKFSYGVTTELQNSDAVEVVTIGTNDANTLSGWADENTLVGLGGDDILTGGGGNDLLLGGDGNDQLEGGAGDDVLDVGSGSQGQVQELKGQAGNDTYVISADSGTVVIGFDAEEDTPGEIDKIVFNDLNLSDITASYVVESANGEELRVTWDNGTNTGQLRIANRADNIEEFQFSDGAILSTIEIATYGRTLLTGTSIGDTIIGSADIDEIFGGGGDGTSWQYLNGQNGNDTYVINKTDGKIFISGVGEGDGANTGTADKVVFTDLNLSDITIDHFDYGNPTNGNSVRLIWDDGVDSGELRIAHGGSRIEEFLFADGTTLSSLELASYGRTILRGTAGDDLIIGSSSDDEVFGGDGDDTLSAGDGVGGGQYLNGQNGNDTYVINKTDGFVFIGGYYETTSMGDADKVVFNDLNLSDITISYYDYGNTAHGNVIRLMWNDGANSGELRIANEGNAIELFLFADGTTLSSLELASYGRTILQGTSGDDLIIGSSADDEIYGGDGDDTLSAGDRDGAGGGQYLGGQAGDDTYLINKTDGFVFIAGHVEDANMGTADRIVFNDLNLSDITIGYVDYGATVNGNAIRLMWNDGTNSGELRIANEGNAIEKFQFADGSTLSSLELASYGRTILQGTSGDDLIIGSSADDEIYGGDGDDTLSAGDGDGAGGGQYLGGQAGDDTYLINKTDGFVFIGGHVENVNMGTADRVVFNDLKLSDITIAYLDYGNTTNGNALRLLWDDGTHSGELRIAHEGSPIEEFQFADGTTSSVLEIATYGRNLLTGTSNDDTITGSAGNDEIFGGDGDDIINVGGGIGTSYQYLHGQYGNDTYVINKDEGNVFIGGNHENVGMGDADRIVFNDLNLSDITIGYVDYNNSYNGNTLRLMWNDGTDSGELRIAHEGSRIETFQFADGTTVSSLELASNGRTILQGTNEDDLIIGSWGDDDITGGDGDDTLDAGTGTGIQTLAGQAGSDTYVISEDNGTVSIGFDAEADTPGEIDKIVFDDLTQSEITVNIVNNGANGDELRLSWDDGTYFGELQIADMANDIEEFHFADGTVIEEW